MCEKELNIWRSKYSVMEFPDFKDDGCPYRSKCVEQAIELVETCIGSTYRSCLKFKKYEDEKAAYVFDSLVGSK